MKHIVRIVSEEGFQGLVTSYVGPFDTDTEAERYQLRTEDPDGMTEAYVEPLYPPQC